MRQRICLAILIQLLKVRKLNLCRAYTRMGNKRLNCTQNDYISTILFINYNIPIPITIHQWRIPLHPPILPQYPIPILPHLHPHPHPHLLHPPKYSGSNASACSSSYFYKHVQNSQQVFIYR